MNQFKQSGASDAQIAQFLPDFLSNIEKARESIFKSDARRSLTFVGLASIFLFLYQNLAEPCTLQFIYASPYFSQAHQNTLCIVIVSVEE